MELIMKIRILVATLSLIGMVCSVSGTAWAKAAHIVRIEAEKTNSAIEACGQAQQGQSLIDCVGAALLSFSSSINKGPVPIAAPSATPLAARGADVNGQQKAAARAVLNRVLATARSLASRGSTEVAATVSERTARIKAEGPAIYNSVAAVFERALSVIERKG